MAMDTLLLIDELINVYQNNSNITTDEKKKEIKIDEEKCKQLNELVMQITQSDIAPWPTNMDSKYLFEIDELAMMRYNCFGYSCTITTCNCFIRMIDILKKYHIWVNQNYSSTNRLENATKNKSSLIDIIFASGYNCVNLLNDFNHLLLYHSIEFEEIYNIVIKKCTNNNICNMLNCIMIARNNRNRLNYDPKNLYGDDDKDIIIQQLIDRIHSYYIHSFDTGYKLQKVEQQKICKCAMKTDDDEKDDNICDSNVDSINSMIKSKQNLYASNHALQRLRSSNKFRTEMDVKHDENEYNYGYRYFYWEFYKNNTDTQDEAHSVATLSAFGNATIANKNSTLGDWYVKHKYNNLKHELLSNTICVIPLASWNHLLQKATIQISTEICRKMKCPRKDSAKCYEMKENQPITTHHVIAMMAHCNCDKLQRKFGQTFRHKDIHETDDEMKRRHRNYYFLGRLLRECVECFGTKWPVYGNIGTITLFHGVDKQFSFASLNAFIKGPLCTTTVHSVAVNFCGHQGMILSFRMDTAEWKFKLNEGMEAHGRLCCFDCHWLSDYANEQEIFCIGGLYQFTINTIIEPNGTDYYNYVTGLKQMTYCMTNGSGLDFHHNIATKRHELQMVLRLLSHQLHSYFPNHPYAHEFKSCPDYFKGIMNKHCASISCMDFYEKKKQQCKLHELFFKYDNDWIKLEILCTLFPNVEQITYWAEHASISFVKQEAIYRSVLQFLANHNDTTSLNHISIPINVAFQDVMDKYLDSYVENFMKFHWEVYVLIDEDKWAGTLMGKVEKQIVIVMERLCDESNE
eukprot:211169_1